MPLLIDIWNFIKSPKYNNKSKSIPVSKKLWYSVRVWCLYLLFVVIASFIISAVLKNSGYSGQNQVELLASQNIWKFFFAAVIIAPILEEFTFRGWLGANRWVLSASLSFGVLFVLEFALSIIMDNGVKNIIGDLFNQISTAQYYIITTLLRIVFFLIAFFVIFNKNNIKKYKKWITRYFSTVFYTSAILFGAVHIFNNTDLSSIWWLLLLLAIPQTIAGVGIGYIRAKFGFWYGVMIHSLNNLIPFIIFWTYSTLSDQIRESVINGEDIKEGMGTVQDQNILAYLGLFIVVVFLFNMAINIFNIIESMKVKNMKFDN